MFELACAVIIALTLAVLARQTPWRSLLRDYGALAIAGWIGEQSCISAYGFYAYAPGWHLRVGDVPLLVPMIWPLVVLSARDVARGLFPSSVGVARAAAVAVFVIIDASLVEVVAVRAGLWAWIEGGHLAVPLIGIIGWGCFAFGAELMLSRGPRYLVPPVAVIGTHVLLLALWWGALRWVLRGDLGHASVVAIALMGAALTALALVARRRGRVIPLEVAGPRLAATSLFLVVLAVSAPDAGPLWAHVASIAAPYVAATGWARA